MKNWKKTIVYSTSFFLVFFAWIAIDLACGGETDPYDYYVSFFHNNVQGEHGYRPFYLNFNAVFDETEPASEADINASEWAGYLGKEVTAADVKKAIYGLTAHDDSLLNDILLIVNNKLPDSLKSNSFLKALILPAHSSALQYYSFVKNIEKTANPGYNKWNPTPTDTTKLSDAAADALLRGVGETDAFLRLRYFYQAQRLFHFCGDIVGAETIYDHFINPIKSESHVKGWALALKAGEERRLHDTVTAAYLFSRVFELYPERRVQAYKNYNYCHVIADSVVKHAFGNEEKAFIYAIDGFSKPGDNLNNLQKVYDLAPNSEAVGVLLVREINKLEESYLTPKLNEHLTGSYDLYSVKNADSINNQLLKRVKPLQNFCNRLAKERKFPAPILGIIASAYLYWLQGGHADEGLALLRRNNNQIFGEKLAGEKAMVTLLLTEQKNEELSTEGELELLPSLQWLDTKVDREIKTVNPGNGSSDNPSLYNKSKFAMSSRDFYKMILAEAYFKQKDTVKGALCLLRSERTLALATPPQKYDDTARASLTRTLPVFWLNYLHSRQLTQLIAMKREPPAAPYLKFLSGALRRTTDQELYELLGTALIREHDYVKAANVFKHIESLNAAKEGVVYVRIEEAADPFINQLADYPKVYLPAHATGYTKAMFAQEMDSLQNKIKTDPKNAANYYFRMATGLYNASHYGNAWYLISYSWSSTDYGRANRYSYDNDYIKTMSAESYYLKARQLSIDPEFKAKCTFMAAKCQQKQIPTTGDIHFGLGTQAYSAAERNNPYFAELQKDYAQTAFFTEALAACSYLKDFLKGDGKK